MREWSDTIDPATIPDEVIIAERARRNAARRSTFAGGRNGGRPKKLYQCEQCGAELYGAAERDKHACKSANG